MTADFIKRRNADKSITMNHASVSDLKKQFKVEYLKIIKISDERIAMCPVDLQTSAGNLSTALTAKRNTFVSDWLTLTGEDIFK